MHGCYDNLEGLRHSLKSMYSRVGFIFDKVAEEVSSEKKDIGSIKGVLENCNLQGKSVLEVGCGIGDSLIYCAQKGTDYVEGFDISRKSIKLAKSKVQNSSNIIFHKCSLEEYETKRKFDFILALGVFEYFDNPLESLKRMCCFLADKGTLILLLSRPIFIKRISFLCRAVLSKVPLKAILPVTRLIAMILKVFTPIFKKMFYAGDSSTYTIEQTVLEALMVPRYNIFHHRIFSSYLRDEGFLIEFFNEGAPSMIGIMARKK